MQPTQNTATNPAVATSTGALVLVPSETAIAELTPARVLRAAAGYLHQFGWMQCDMFDDPTLSTPCACVLGAIRMAVMGTPEVCAEQLRPDVLAAFNAAVAVLADHLISDHDQPAPAVPFGVTFPSDREHLVGEWNDHPNRNLSQVLAALHGAADEWERIHFGVPADLFADLPEVCAHNRPVGGCECDFGTELEEVKAERLAGYLGGDR